MALQLLQMLNGKRVMWANDYPHLDSTWPNSQELIEERTAHLSAEQRADLLHNNVAALYKR
jgi:uncharacterized protein